MVMGKWHEYTYICMCITVIEVIISEIVLEKIGVYKVFYYQMYRMFWWIKTGSMCLETVTCSVVVQQQCAYKLEWYAYFWLLEMIFIMVVELCIMQITQEDKVLKQICLCDGSILNTQEKIRMRDNETIQWKNCDRIITVNEDAVERIVFCVHSVSNMTRRKIELKTGEKLCGYRYSCASKWYGIGIEQETCIRVELFPRGRVKIKEDWIQKDDETKIRP